MSWITDQVSAAAAGAANSWTATPYTDSLTRDELFSTLHPSTTFFYMNEVPELDGWKHPYWYAWSQNVLSASVIAIASQGRDGTTSQVIPSNATIGPFTPTNYVEDIVWADGFFVRWPSGSAT